MVINQIVDILGLIAGLVFIYVNIRASRSMVGSFFKKYYVNLIVASLFFALGWATNFFEVLGISSADTAEFLHHLFLLLSGIVFVAASYYLPKEAAEYMKTKEARAQ
ncbi:MAG: hypothetical protein M1155_02880 [Patescibacteria group bacterium]|nr:hypothetical protein [Patescibacteria group bacterium]